MHIFKTESFIFMEMGSSFSVLVPPEMAVPFLFPLPLKKFRFHFCCSNFRFQFIFLFGSIFPPEKLKNSAVFSSLTTGTWVSSFGGFVRDRRDHRVWARKSNSFCSGLLAKGF